MASFSIQAVNSAVTETETALSWAEPAAIVVGELVRLVLALGESVCDVSRLKNGCQIVLFKDNQTWTFSLEGIAAAFANADKIDDDPAEKLRMTYKDYLRIFLLFVDGNTLALRTSTLIELNVTNYRDRINADEDAMARAELFDLAKAATDFRLTTTVDLRMLFLSMPFAQKGIDWGKAWPDPTETRFVKGKFCDLLDIYSGGVLWIKSCQFCFLAIVWKL